MNVNLKRRLLQSVCIIGVSASLISCKLGFDEAGSGTSSANTDSYTGSGSIWKLDLGKNGQENFTLTRKSTVDGSANLTLEGTYKTFTNTGFTELDVTSKSDQSAENKIAVIRATDNIIFMLPAFGSSNLIIPMITEGTCPTEVRGNWIRFLTPVNEQTENDPQDFGSLHYKSSSNVIDFNDRFDLDALLPSDEDRLSSTQIESADCTDGIASITDGRHFFASGNLAILDLHNDNSNENQMLFAFGRDTIQANTDFDGDFAGALSNGGASSGNQTYPVHVNCTSGVCNIEEVTDLENGTTSTSNAGFTLTLDGDLNQPVAGFVTGKIAVEGGDSNADIACMFNNNDKIMLVCAGKSPENVNQSLKIFLTDYD